MVWPLSGRGRALGEFLERSRLAELTGNACDIGARQSLTDVLGESPSELLVAHGPSIPAVDIDTYRVRRDRWRAGQGPDLHGIEEFLAALEGQEEPGRVVNVSGRKSTYLIVLDEALAHVMAAMAIDRPASDRW